MGECNGDCVGEVEGRFVGGLLGGIDGTLVGVVEGFKVGSMVGSMVGSIVGDLEGRLVGVFVGNVVGFTVGKSVGCMVGWLEGVVVGTYVGLVVGAVEGVVVGVCDGGVEGCCEGVCVGDSVVVGASVNVDAWISKDFIRNFCAGSLPPTYILSPWLVGKATKPHCWMNGAVNVADWKDSFRVFLLGLFSKVKVRGKLLYWYTVGYCAFFGSMVFQLAQLPPATSQLRSVSGKEAISPWPIGASLYVFCCVFVMNGYQRFVSVLRRCYRRDIFCFFGHCCPLGSIC